jgi:hypothetical protein
VLNSTLEEGAIALRRNEVLASTLEEGTLIARMKRSLSSIIGADATTSRRVYRANRCPRKGNKQVSVGKREIHEGRGRHDGGRGKNLPIKVLQQQEKILQ